MQVIKSLIKKIKKTLFTKQNLALVALFISFLYFSKSSNHGIPFIRLNYFIAALSRNYISEIYLSGPTIKFKGPSSDWYQTDRSMLPPKTLDQIMINYPQVNILKEESIFHSFNRSSILLYSLGLLVLVQTVRFLKEMPKRSVIKNEKLTNSSIKFADVCGYQKIKEEFHQIIEFLNFPEKFLQIGARTRKGVLLYGLPGTGKTLMAKVFFYNVYIKIRFLKAVAGEANVPFLSCVGSEFNEIYTGAGQKKIRDLFQLARQNSPCIIFIDELDGLGSRSRTPGFLESKETTNTINQVRNKYFIKFELKIIIIKLLSEIDGFRENSMVLVLATTSKINLIDDALMRSGRFDLKLKMDLPDEHERLELLKHFMGKVKESIF